ncbi:MAG: ImmA/IrrE family metallo-endopeptidase [Dehalococcoidales bacterium]|nr:ImmA/IrrE family metallo-endopeptidase [Dehalococcoidales bacterium]
MSFPPDLRNFCIYLTQLYGHYSTISEDLKAGIFLEMFFGDSAVNVESIKELARNFGINVDALDTMPGNLRGYHEVYENSKHIYYKQGDAASGIENTILHEIREMMEPYFEEISQFCIPLDEYQRHIAANQFASAVLLPGSEFLKNAHVTGLDIVKLAKDYSKSYAQVLLRLGEVIGCRRFFYGALYERDRQTMKWLVKYRTLYPTLFPDVDYRQLGSFFPKKGMEVTSGSPADMAIKTRKPYVVRILTLMDFRPEKGQISEGLVALARPLNASLVSLVVVSYRDRNLFEPQINKINPVILLEPRIIDL